MRSAEKVFRFFEEISKIPRESKDEKAIGEYLVDFAQKRDLEVYIDDSYNVIIKKPATVKDCKCAPLIIQGHTDMVYVQDETCTQKYEDGLKLVEKDGWLSAEGTTLGADNGIAVAFALAVLDSDNILHPDLEAVFTVSEEIGLLGAECLDYSKLSGKYMINLDTEDEGIVFTSCAGAFRAKIDIPLEFVEVKDVIPVNLKISGLTGGHSGMEINNGRANAAVLLGRILCELEGLARVGTIDADGKTNAICSGATAQLFTNSENLDNVKEIVAKIESTFRTEYENLDDIKLGLEIGNVTSAKVYTEVTQRNVKNALVLIPDGVIRMSVNVPNLVETSANIGILLQEDNTLSLNSTARSCVGSRKNEMRAKYTAIAELMGAEVELSGDYPQWEYRVDSPLRDLAMECYREQYGKEASTCAIHAGLECGFFDEKLDGVDIISIGPNIEDVHTPRERIDIESTKRVWGLTVNILEKLANR